MEEILASIRRIIADDDGAKGQAKAPEALAPPRPSPPPPVVPAPRAAPPPPPPPAPPEPAQTQDEIDDMLTRLHAVHAAAPAAVPEEPAADILELTESMAAPAPPPPPPPPAPAPIAHGFRTIDAQSDVVFEDSPSPQPPPAGERDELRHHARDADESTLMSSATSAAVDSAFNTLAQTVLVQNARTLEDLVREMLRPMLKTWLDDNLPNLVERLVRAEIERVSRGRG
jgi:cell pole-organizing protein PopZ